MVGSHHCNTTGGVTMETFDVPHYHWWVLPWKPLMYHTTTGGLTCCLVSFASCTALACSSSNRILVATATVCMEEEREREGDEGCGGGETWRNEDSRPTHQRQALQVKQNTIWLHHYQINGQLSLNVR